MLSQVKSNIFLDNPQRNNCTAFATCTLRRMKKCGTSSRMRSRSYKISLTSRLQRNRNVRARQSPLFFLLSFMYVSCTCVKHGARTVEVTPHFRSSLFSDTSPAKRSALFKYYKDATGCNACKCHIFLNGPWKYLRNRKANLIDSQPSVQSDDSVHCFLCINWRVNIFLLLQAFQ